MVQKNGHYTLIGVMSFIRVGGSLWRWLRNIRVEVFIRIFISQFLNADSIFYNFQGYGAISSHKAWIKSHMGTINTCHDGRDDVEK